MRFTRRLKEYLRQIGVLFPAHDVKQRFDALQRNEKVSVAAKTGQLLLANQWRSMAERNERLPQFDEIAFRAFSGGGEDGILLYIFSLIGTTQKTTVEICAGDGIQCNSANLILNHGWTGLLVDGNKNNTEIGRKFYAQQPDTFSFPPTLAHAWVDRETVNELIASHGYKGEVDLLSIDLDGVDYWIWDAIEVIQPRVVVVETQCIWGAEKSVTVPYQSDFKSPLVDGFGIYSGASLPAFVKLAKRKGYRLVGAEGLGFNAFFIREDIATELLPEVDARSCLNRPFVRWATEKFLPLVRHKEWVEV